MSLKDNYLTISQAVEYTGLTRQKISTLIKQGRLPAERIGRQVLIEKRVLDGELIKEKERFLTNSLSDNINDSVMSFRYKTCDKCGKQVSNNDTFCLNCGNEIEE